MLRHRRRCSGMRGVLFLSVSIVTGHGTKYHAFSGRILGNMCGRWLGRSVRVLEFQGLHGLAAKPPQQMRRLGVRTRVEVGVGHWIEGASGVCVAAGHGALGYLLSPALSHFAALAGGVVWGLNAAGWAALWTRRQAGLTRCRWLLMESGRQIHTRRTRSRDASPGPGRVCRFDTCLGSRICIRGSVGLFRRPRL